MSRRMSKVICDGRSRRRMRNIIRNEHEYFMRCYHGKKDEHTWLCICTMSMWFAWTHILRVMMRMRSSVNLEVGNIMSNIRETFVVGEFSLVEGHQEWDWFFDDFFFQIQEIVDEQKPIASTIKGNELGLELYADWIQAFPYADALTKIKDHFIGLDRWWERSLKNGRSWGEVMSRNCFFFEKTIGFTHWIHSVPMGAP